MSPRGSDEFERRKSHLQGQDIRQVANDTIDQRHQSILPPGLRGPHSFEIVMVRKRMTKKDKERSGLGLFLFTAGK